MLNNTNMMTQLRGEREQGRVWKEFHEKHNSFSYNKIQIEPEVI